MSVLNLIVVMVVKGYQVVGVINGQLRLMRPEFRGNHFVQGSPCTPTFAAIKSGFVYRG